MTGWTRGEDPLVDLADDARVADAIAARAEQRDLTARATELATLAGTLHDLAERRAGIGVTTTSGRTVQGTAVGLAVDHLAVATGAGQLVFVRLDRVALVRPDPSLRAPAAQGERDPGHDLLLLERLAHWVDDRPEVAVGLTGVGDLVRGRLVAVAEDVLTLVAGPDRSPTYLAAEAIEVVAIDHGGRA